MSADQGHFSYSKHLTAEVETEELVRGSMKRYWKYRATRTIISTPRT